MEAYERFEQEWARWNRVDPTGTVATNSGTSALHLSFEAMELPQGALVACPEFTMIACPRSITLAGLEPVFVDCTPTDLLMDLDKLDQVCSEHHGSIKAVMVVHVYGRKVPMQQVHALASKYNLLVIEDLAEAHGVEPHPRTDAACWSHYANKCVAGQEGGSIFFRKESHAQRARLLRSLGFTKAHDMTHLPRGHNYRLANVLAELILTSLQQADSNLQKRRRIESIYDRHCPPQWRMPARDVVWVYDFRISDMTQETQDRVVRTLRENGIQARHGFKPCSLQEEYLREYGSSVKLDPRTLPMNAYRASQEVIYLPVDPEKVGEAESQARQAFEVLHTMLGHAHSASLPTSQRPAS